MNRRLLVLCYHNVDATWFSPLSDGPSSFERHVRLLRRVTNIVPLTQALDALDGRGRLPARAVSLTFDDGYRDNLEIAVPLLQRVGLPATFFLVSAFLGHQVRPWWEELAWALRNATATRVEWVDRVVQPQLLGPTEVAQLVAFVSDGLKTIANEERSVRVANLVAACAPEGRFDSDLFLDWDGARDLVRRGFEVGSHSEAHLILARERPAVQRADLVRARQELERELDRPVTVLAYPNGRAQDFSDETCRAATLAGYTHALTTEFGWNEHGTPRLALRRVIVEPRQLSGLVRPFWWDRREVLRTLGRATSQADRE